ncbi:MAG TPA: hypothetical protein PLE38_16805, partial [Usitatibacteraceae bacterium]|nr:hypothetical protein [Usitatibacteraceae bacterium]
LVLGRLALGEVTPDKPSPLIDNASILSLGGKPVNRKCLFGVRNVIEPSDNAHGGNFTPSGLFVS